MIRLPKLTILISAFCIVVFFSGANELGMYQREQSNPLWIYFFTSFTHYNVYHLWTNLLVFLILASTFELSNSFMMLFLVSLITSVSTVLVLHFFLPLYSQFSGISCINFTLLAYLLLVETRHKWQAMLALSLLLIFYEVVVILTNSSSSLTLGKPVWQLHALAFLIGVVFYYTKSLARRTEVVPSI